MRTRMVARRKQLGWTQEVAADKSGLSRAHYSHIERGRSEPSLDQMKSIAEAFGIEANVSFFDMNRDDSDHKRNHSA